MNSYLEQQVWELKEKNAELEERVIELEREFKEIKNNNQHDFKEILNAMDDAKSKISEFAKSIDVIAEWKKWIDKIIEKIKKILPI